jgi:anhydro-N-acetylmuramic acid kinase
MIYRAIGIMSGSSLDGLDIAFVEFTETGGKWTYEILNAECFGYDKEWKEKLQEAVLLPALDYQLLHTAYGHYIGKKINSFIGQYGLEHKVNLVSSHGHTSFHLPGRQMTAQLGDGAAIAAKTGLSVVSDLRSLDIALGGQGAPIVPIGEKLLFAGYDHFLNIGGIANISVHKDGKCIAFDVCAANRVLNMLAGQEGLQYDDGGQLAAMGNVDINLLNSLNSLEYYREAYPKSLANSFGTDIVYPIIQASGVAVKDGLRTYTEHIALQVANAIAGNGRPGKLLVTGGGAMNTFLIQRLKTLLDEKNIEVIIPDKKTIEYKEAVIMALIGVLRWREEENVLSSVTGASRGSVGGALWIG